MSSCGTTNVKFLLRRDTNANWQGKILRDGEPGFATDTKILKIGLNGAIWELLPAVGASVNPVAAAVQFDGGDSTNSYTAGPVLDCGSVL
jgi:Major tropism determinant N-terminal domain